MDHLSQQFTNKREVSLALHPPVPAHVKASKYNIESAEKDEPGGGLVGYWRMLLRHRWKIVFASLAGLAAGFCLGIPMQPVYRAHTSLEVLILNDDFMNMKQANPTTSNDNSYDTSEEQTQAKLLQSSALIDRVVAKLDPDSSRSPIVPKAATVGWRKLLHLSQPVHLTQRELLLNSAASSLKVRPAVRTRVLDVTVDSIDPQLAVDFANTLAQEFMTQSMEARWSSTQRTGEWLKRELDDARDKLRHSEDQLQSYAKGSGLIFTDDSTNVATERLQQAQQQLSDATAERISRQSRFELAQKSPPDAVADVLSDASLRETQSKINDLQRQIADLSAVFNPEYSKIRRLQAELESLNAAFTRSRSDILFRIRNDYEEAERKERLLAAALNAQAQEVTGQDEKAIQYNILKRDVDSSRQLYDTMLQQMKQAAIASAMRASNVAVVDPAKLPSSPVSPNFRLNSAAGALAGLFLSIVVITAHERADRTLNQPGDIKLWADLQELGTIPSSKIDSHYGSYARTARKTIKATAPRIDAPLSTSPNGSPIQSDAVELVTFQRRPSFIAEAFRSALTSILFIGENGSRPRVLVFTSASVSDGKTTIASNLAIAAAEIRCRVLIIDADLRRPRMHKIFNIGNETGLGDLLRESLSEEQRANIIKETSIKNLFVLPAGPPTEAAAHLLYSPNFGNALSELREQYDLILIDTPPMLQMTDARVAGRLADAVVLVARSGRTTRDAILAAKERFSEDRIRVLGTILNDWDPKRSSGGYYGQYYNSYGAHPFNYRS